MKRLLLVLAVTAGLLVLSPGTSWACSCVSSTPVQQVKRADTVFTGQVVWTASNGISTRYGVKVAGVFKGRAGVREELLSPLNSASCGLGQLAVDKTYVFFVHGEHPGQMQVDSCGGTTVSSTGLVTTVQAATGPPQAPVRPPAGPVAGPGHHGTSTWHLLGYAVLALLVVAGATAVVRRRGTA
ncbi:MAG: hypothetical protein JWP74_1649 [Marmoricola sp.]|nr:hypothetical protein [Marmoricola sp.]